MPLLHYFSRYANKPTMKIKCVKCINNFIDQNLQNIICDVGKGVGHNYDPLP